VSKISISIRELIAFNDEDTSVAQHASSVKAISAEELGLALLKNYWESKSGVATVYQPCNTGRRSGPRLDGWMKVEKNDDEILYQVEVKAWSFHSIGGRALPISASPEKVAEFKRERWRRYWASTGFKDKELNKVLVQMRSPVPGMLVEPLACLWDAVHPEGASDPFFSIEANSDWFRRVNVFSMSSYLRGLVQDRLELDLPITYERLKWLLRIFPMDKVDGVLITP
jgi:hypothetical protein